MATKTTTRKKTTTKTGAKTDAPTITIFRAAPGGAYHWRRGDSVSAKRYMARSQAERAALKACPGAEIVHEPEPRKDRPKRAPKQDHETPSPKEIANTANLEAYANAKSAKQPRAKKASPTDPRSRNHVSLLDAAESVLAEAEQPMRAKAIVEAAVERGLWAPGAGKTPHATLHAAMTGEIKTKGADSRFGKAGRGLFEAAGR